ncbi:MAG: GNAT family N-acetyltransferase [Saprospiraceae bacterium]|nr:GNAT family N-acetyltransferase [Saprospiraceae bacterium]
MSIEIRATKGVSQTAIIDLYKSVDWSSANKPDKLYQALLNSHTLLTAWDGDRLIGLGNALSDGFLVVYYAHLVVHPNYQGKGVGRMIVNRFQEKYGDFHQQILVADGGSINFYQKCGFERAGQTEPMWIYQGDEH